jgi:hypothetical protein
MPIALQKKLAKNIPKHFTEDKEELEERMAKAEKAREERLQQIKAQGEEKSRKIAEAAERKEDRHLIFSKKAKDELDLKLLLAEVNANKALAERMEKGANFGTKSIEQAKQNKIRAEQEYEAALEMWRNQEPKDLKLQAEERKERVKARNQMIMERLEKTKFKRFLSSESKKQSLDKAVANAEIRRQQALELKKFKAAQMQKRLEERKSSGENIVLPKNEC